MKIPKQAYTIEFKELAIKRIKDGQSVSKVCKELGLSDQTSSQLGQGGGGGQTQRRWRQGGDAGRHGVVAAAC
jgi:transposase-like protein